MFFLPDAFRVFFLQLEAQQKLSKSFQNIVWHLRRACRMDRLQWRISLASYKGKPVINSLRLGENDSVD